MRSAQPVRITWARFTSCSGCQLMLVNCESSLAALAGVVELVNFPLVTSRNDRQDTVAVALVEGALSTPAEVERLLELRQAAGLLVAVGACALTGGVNALAGGDRRHSLARVYGKAGGSGRPSFPPQPAHHFVKIDWQIPGCPPESGDLLQTVAALLRGGCPGRQQMPVCMECRSNETPCLLIGAQVPCLGPVTLAGCHARCPGLGVPCEGCRGGVPEANRDELYQLLVEIGLPDREIRHRLARFGEIPP